jgi:hypothetical protein
MTEERPRTGNEGRLERQTRAGKEKADKNENTTPEANGQDATAAALAAKFEKFKSKRPMVTSTISQIAMACRRPDPDEWITVHPSSECMLQVKLASRKSSRDTLWMVTDEIADLIPALCREYILRLAVTSTGIPFILPVRLPSNPEDRWAYSYMRAIGSAEGRWKQIRSKKEASAYETRDPLAKIDAPDWPTQPFLAMVEAAFLDRMIDDRNHPFIQDVLYGGRVEVE